MSFLAPFFLLGALAVSLPILFHLIRKTIREKQVFSSLMFLLPTPPKITRQSRLENLLLLLLRCAVICLLALAFARPLFQRTTPDEASPDGVRQVAILIDVSASMHREDLWAQATRRAEALLADTRPTDLIALYTFDRHLHPVVTFEQIRGTAAAERRNTLQQALASLKPGWGRGDLGPALIATAELFESAPAPGVAPVGQRRIELISDFAEGSHLDGLQGHEWHKSLQVALNPVKARQPTNVGLQLLPERGEEETPQGTVIRFRAMNSSDATREQFHLRIRANPTNAPTSIDLYVPPGQNRVLTANVGGTEPAEFRLEGDDAGFDNVATWVPPVAEKTRILYLGRDNATDPNGSLYYLLKAFTAGRHRQFEILSIDPAKPLDAAPLQDVSLVFVTAELTVDAARAARTLVEGGRTLVYALPGAQAPVAEGLAALLQVGEAKLTEAPRRNFNLLGQVDLTHPLLQPFADARFGDFTKIHFWRHRRVAPENLPVSAKVVASFDDEAPAIVDVPVGRGFILLLASGWVPADSQLALSTKFVPLLYSLLERSRPTSTGPGQRVVGDMLPVQAWGTNTVRTLRRPDGTQVLVTEKPAALEPDEPGIYVAVETGVRMAVNLPPEESRTAPIARDHFERLGVPLPQSATVAEAHKAEERKRILAATELENRQKLWRWLIVAGFLFVLAETWLAGRLSRPRTEAAPVAS
jgi:hypothetical protein